MQLDLFFLPNFALNNLTPYFMKLKKVLFGLCLVIFNIRWSIHTPRGTYFSHWNMGRYDFNLKHRIYVESN